MALIYFVLCFVCEKPFLFPRFEKLGNSSYFFAAICKYGPSCHVVLGVSVYALFFVVVEVVFRLVY
jgi:hypothetical protein